MQLRGLNLVQIFLVLQILYSEVALKNNVDFIPIRILHLLFVFLVLPVVFKEVQNPVPEPIREDHLPKGSSDNDKFSPDESADYFRKHNKSNPDNIYHSTIRKNNDHVACCCRFKNAKLNDEPIICDVGYNKFRSISASWSNWDEYIDDRNEYFLLNYTSYASSFQEFSRKYPTATIKTIGQAESPETFGDRGKYEFGTLTYDTDYFNIEADGVAFNIKLVDANAYKCAIYNVTAKIGLGFKKRGTKLYLCPFINGQVVGHGMYNRSLNFGLKVTNVTFNPK